MVTFEKVKKVFSDGTVAVDELDLEIARGELVAFIGPSGCGKTTSLKMINSLEPLTSGRITVEGQDITTVDAVKLRRSIGYVIQEVALMPHMTVSENIAIVPRLCGWDEKKIRNRVNELLEMGGLPPGQYRNRLPDQLSGGQKQRVGVLRALASDPKVILMDEPFGALDPISREKLQDELLELQSKVKKTIIFVTHDMDEALKMADKIVLLRRGKIEQTGSPHELLENPSNSFVQSFIGEDRLSQICPDASVDVLLKEPGLKLDAGLSAVNTLARMESEGRETAQLVDSDGFWHGMVSLPQVKAQAEKGGAAVDKALVDRKLYIEEANLRDAAEMLADLDIPIPVIDKDNRFLGVVTEGGMARLTIGRLRRSKAKEGTC